MTNGNPSPETIQVLRSLRDHHNVLISGPPGTGKSRLLGEVSRWFQASAYPGHVAGAPIPLPDGTSVIPEEIAEWLPSPDRSDRKPFLTAFHQGTRYRDFLRGLTPIVGGQLGFTITSGTMYKAALHALEPDGASLLIVDEINRGPAVQIFGGSVVAMESDKRLAADGTPTESTQPFDLLADDGDLMEFALPHHLYVLAAMNQADTSVEPLDVAFLRRFEPFELLPDPAVLQSHLKLENLAAIPPTTPTNSQDVYLAVTRAWMAINRRITMSRGPMYQIGHGVFLGSAAPAATVELDEAIAYVAGPWRKIRSHVDEVFFGHIRGVAAVLNVGSALSPLRLDEAFFAGDPVATLEGEKTADLYQLLLAVGDQDAG